MAEDNPKHNPIFKEQVKGLAIGDNNIIYNYFGYKEESRPATVDAADDNLLCPYRGLYHFNPNDAEYFFGRNVFVDQLFEATKKRNFIPILGASGSGKSSVVLAGLIPKLELEQKDHWKFTHFRPGSDPFHALALALVPLYRPELDATDEIIQARKLAKSLSNNQDSEDNLPLSDVFAKIKQNNLNHKILLIADQFEELYTQCSDSQVRRRFLDCLLTSFQSSSSNSGASSSTTLVTTMRADFLANALAYRPFADMLQNADIKLGAMSREELTEVIEKPAEKLGVTFEVGLVERILNDVEDEPGNLPLLEFALTELWTKRTGKQLTHKAYEAIGQVKGALADYADDKYKKLTAEEKEQARRIFIQLVRPGEGTEDTRRRANRAELGEENWGLITRQNGLADSRLVVTSRNDNEQEIVEVVHEALIQNWGQLRQWMETDRKFRVWQEQLRAAMHKWEETNQDEGALLRGAPLLEAEDWQKTRLDELSENERDFIRTSLSLRDREKKEQDLRRQFTILGLASGLGITILLGTVAGIQWQRSEKQRQIAVARQIAAQAELTQNQQTDLLPRSILLAIEAMQKFPSLGSNQTLRKGLKLLPRLVDTLDYENIVDNIAFSPNGTYLATSILKTREKSTEKMVKIWNLADRDKSYTLKTGSERIESVIFSPDGKYLVVVQKDVGIWEIPNDREIIRLSADNAVNFATFSPNGRYLATANKDKTVRIWEVPSGRDVGNLSHKSEINTVVFSPDGRYLATASSDKTARVWQVDTGSEITKMKHQGNVWDIVFSPDGRYLATASDDKTARVWRVDTGSEITKMKHQGNVWDIVFSPDGRYLATASGDKTARVWQVDTGSEVTRINQGRSVNSVEFSPDGIFLVTCNGDNTARMWRVTTGEEIARMTHDDSVRNVTFSPNGKYIATASNDNTARIWELTNDQKLMPMIHEGHINNVVVSPNGKLLATASKDKTARIWDISSGREVARLNHKDEVNTLIFSSDGRYLATASGRFELASGYISTAQDTSARIWEVRTGREFARITHNDRVADIAFSPNGKFVATASRDKTARVWDLENNSEVANFIHDSWVNAVDFSPDGKFLVAAGGGINREFSSVEEILNSGTDVPRVWEIGTREEVVSLSHNYRAFDDEIAFSPDGKFIATAGNDNTVRVWESMTGREIARMTHDNYITADLAFSPDGKFIATAGNNTVRVWEFMTGREIARMTHEDEIAALAFSPNGKFIATAGNDNTARVWESMTGNEIARMTHEDGVTSLAFSPNGEYLTTAANNQLFLWTWHPEKLIAQACDHLSRNLTFQEWKSYLGNQLYSKTCSNLPIHFSYLHEGGKLASEGNIEEARAIFRRASKLEPKLKLDPEKKIKKFQDAKLADTLVEEGKELVIKGNIKGAIAKFQQVGKLYPSSNLDSKKEIEEQVVKILINKLQKLFASGDVENAIIYTQKLVEFGQKSDSELDIDPEQLRSFMIREAGKNFLDQGNKQIKIGDIEGAIASFRKSVELLLKLDPKLNVDPETTSIRLVAEELIKRGDDLENASAKLPEKTALALKEESIQILFDQGHEQVQADNIIGAIASFRKAVELALKLDPKLDVDLETTPIRWVAEKLIKRGDDLESASAKLPEKMALALKEESIQILFDRGYEQVKEDNIEGAITSFHKAVKLSLQLDPNQNFDPQQAAIEITSDSLIQKGIEFIKQGKLQEARIAHAKAIEVAPDMAINSWNSLCWSGSLYGYAADFTDACEKVVSLASESGQIRDSRGLNRALMGNIEGAIEDFQVFIDWVDNNKELTTENKAEFNKLKLKRQGWIDDLRVGNNPFTPKELEDLRNE